MAEKDTKVKMKLGEQVLTVVAKSGKDGKDSDPKEVADVLKSDSSFVDSIRGERGEDGADADEEEIIERVIPTILEKVPTVDDILSEIELPQPPTISDIIKNIPIPKDGRDGSPDTPEQVRDKLLSVGLDYYSLENLPDIPQMIRSVSSKTVSLSELDDVDLSGVEQVNGKYVLGGGGIESIVAGTNITVDNTDPDNPIISATVPTPTTPTLQEVTDEGATTTVESTFSTGIVTPQLKASTSAGQTFKTNSGSDWLHGGNGGGANATMYGGWNYDNATASTVPQFSASKTIESSSVTNTELGYLSGVTSPLQTQLDAKQATITTGTTAQYFRGDLSLATFPTNVSSFTNDAGYLTSVSLTSTQIGYGSGSNTLTGSSNLTWNNTDGILGAVTRFNYYGENLLVRDNRVPTASECDRFFVRTAQNSCIMQLQTSIYDTNATTTVNFYKGSGIGTNYTNWYSGTTRLLLMGINNSNRPILEAGSSTIFTFSVGNSSGFVVTTGASSYITFKAGSIFGSGPLTLYGTSHTTGNEAGLYCPNGDSAEFKAGSTTILTINTTQATFAKPVTPVSSSDASAPNNSIYYSTDAGKLVYKDSGGTVNNLY